MHCPWVKHFRITISGVGSVPLYSKVQVYGAYYAKVEVFNFTARYRRVLITLLASEVFPPRVTVSIKASDTPFGDILPSQNTHRTIMEPDRTIVTTVWVSFWL